MSITGNIFFYFQSLLNYNLARETPKSDFAPFFASKYPLLPMLALYYRQQIFANKLKNNRCSLAYLVIYFQDGTPTSRTFDHVPSEIGAEEAEEVGVEHLLRDIKDTTVGEQSYWLLYQTCFNDQMMRVDTQSIYCHLDAMFDWFYNDLLELIEYVYYQGLCHKGLQVNWLV